MAELLLSRGADVERRTRGGDTALLLALREGKHDMATWLLDRGARAEAVDARSRTVLFLAVTSGYPDVGRLLERAGVKQQVDAKCGTYERTALHAAAEQGCVNHVRQLVAAGASCRAKGKYDNTPLHLACGRAHLEVMRELLQHGADVNAKDHTRASPLVNVPQDILTKRNSAEEALREAKKGLRERREAWVQKLVTDSERGEIEWTLPEITAATSTEGILQDQEDGSI